MQVMEDAGAAQKQHYQSDLRWLYLSGALVKRRGRVFRGDYGLQIVPFPPFLLAVTVVCSEGCSCRNFLRRIQNGVFHVSTVHHGVHSCVCGQQCVGVDSDWSLCRASLRSLRNCEGL